MSNTIQEYREAKSHYEALLPQAKKELLARFKALCAEGEQIQTILRDDFDEKVAFPSKRGRPVKRAPKAVKNAAVPAPPQAANVNKIAKLEKRIAAKQQQVQAVDKQGGDTKTLDDQLYELQDALRLAKES